VVQVSDNKKGAGMIANGNLNYIRPEDTIMNVSIDYIKLALLYESKYEIQKILCNNFDRKKHFRGKKWDGDVYDFNGYKIIHTYLREFNNCNVLRLSQPTTTVAHDIHDLLIDYKIDYVLSMMEISFDCTPVNNIQLDDLQLFFERTLYQLYCPVNKYCEFHIGKTFYSKKTRRTKSCGIKVYPKEDHFIRFELELKNHALKRVGWKYITDIDVMDITTSLYFRLLVFDLIKVSRYLKSKGKMRNPVTCTTMPFMTMKRIISQYAKNWSRYTKNLDEWNKYFQESLWKYN